MAGGGPIVRKYGFPNFAKIFGEKPLAHGVDDEPKAEEAAEAKPSEKPPEKPRKKPPKKSK